MSVSQENSATYCLQTWPPLTWNAGDAEDVRVADKEALQDVSRLVGIDDHSFGDGLCAGADPHQRR